MKKSGWSYCKPAKFKIIEKNTEGKILLDVGKDDVALKKEILWN